MLGLFGAFPASGQRAAARADACNAAIVEVAIAWAASTLDV